MTSTQIAIFSAIILALAFLDVFCDVRNARQAIPWRPDQPSQKTSDDSSGSKSITPWPLLGQRWAERPTVSSKGPTQGPKKWIQQNNLWIKNEQAASVGINEPGKEQTGFSSHLPRPLSNSGGLLSGTSQNLPKVINNTPKSNVPLGPVDKSVTTPKTSFPTSSNKPGSLSGVLGGPVQNIPKTVSTTPKSNLPDSSSKPGSYAGAVGGFAQNIPKIVSSTTPKSNLPTSSSKPGSYAGVVGAKASPSPPVPPKIPAITVPKGSSGGDNTNMLSTGPSDLGGNQEVDERAPDTSGTTDDELRQFSEMLIKKDTNNAMRYVTLQLQGMTTSRSTNDEAPQPLIKVDPAAYQIPSIEKLKLLYNNYILQSNQNEVYTPQERIEENNLLDTVLATPVMQFARSFLIQKGKIGRDPREFKDLLRLIWFNMYSRGQGRIGSSGFEHVFLAEIKHNQVSGLHNWLYFEEEEAKQHANYLGYMRKVDLEDKGAIVKYHFRFNDIDKPVGSMFVGTSPELEMAVYSTCFILRPDKPCPLKMGGNRFVVRTFTYRYRGKNMIGSAFPEI